MLPRDVYSKSKKFFTILIVIKSQLYTINRKLQFNRQKIHIFKVLFKDFSLSPACTRIQ